VKENEKYFEIFKNILLLRAFLVSRVQQGVLGFGRSQCKKKKEGKTTLVNRLLHCERMKIIYKLSFSTTCS
jgi:hypothetical protein